MRRTAATAVIAFARHQARQEAAEQTHAHHSHLHGDRPCQRRHAADNHRVARCQAATASGVRDLGNVLGRSRRHVRGDTASAGADHTTRSATCSSAGAAAAGSAILSCDLTRSSKAGQSGCGAAESGAVPAAGVGNSACSADMARLRSSRPAAANWMNTSRSWRPAARRRWKAVRRFGRMSGGPLVGAGLPSRQLVRCGIGRRTKDIWPQLVLGDATIGRSLNRQATLGRNAIASTPLRYGRRLNPQRSGKRRCIAQYLAGPIERGDFIHAANIRSNLSVGQ